jgi:hypothetical protein
MKNTIDFKASNYFTGMPYVLGFLLTPIGFVLLFSPQLIVGAILLVAGVIILTTHYRLSIDHTKKQYAEYVFVLGLKTGMERKSFSSIDYVFIKKVRVSQTLNSRASSTTIQKDQYDGFLKFSEDDKVHLMTFESKDKLQKKLRPIASQLNLRILDYSNENPVDTRP